VAENGLDREQLVWMFTQMTRIREFEERVKRTFEEHPGVIRGHTHLADGAEASIVGAISTLRDHDQLLTTYRCHGYPLVLGTDPKTMMAEIYGRKDGLCKGYGGSMHLTDVGRGFLGTSGIVGQGIPHAAGAAWAAQIRGEGQVVLSFFGDGASKQGAFHETLNIASLWKLPVVFVMENNSYNVVTRVEQEDANAAVGEPLVVKAQAYSMPGVTVDGGDPVEVHEQVGAAVERARSGDGPTLVESRVYRLSAHGNIIAPPGVPLHFPEHEAITVFGNAEEFEAAKRGDPVPRFRARLVTDGTLSAEEADAIAEAIREEMERDETVLYFGQNIATSDNDPFLQAFGADRVRVTPISETAEIGIAVGAAFAGYRPVVQLYMAEFMLVAMDQVVNEAPRFHYMTAGQVKVPIVLQAGYGFTAGWAGQHTGTIYGMFMGVPGLKVAVPATAADAKGLMTASIRDDNPVVFFHHYLLTLEHGDVPEGEHVVPLGQASVVREGGDVTVVGIGHMVGKALEAAEQLAGEGVNAEVIDPRTLAPLDTETILASVEKTGRLVIVDQSTRHGSAAAVIAAEVASEGFSSLKAPVRLVCALDATIPYSEPMEAYLLPDAAKVVTAVQQVLGEAPVPA
jgi:acetoin:2,6-dichlorophenolindophenol oxidoreductase subunit alpha